jgi:hypothetical protein
MVGRDDGRPLQRQALAAGDVGPGQEQGQGRATSTSSRKRSQPMV